jgi:heme-degrading monooxygenase HmoA
MGTFAVVMTFDETGQDTDAGVVHVRDEVVPALAGAPGLLGLWLVDRDRHRRITVMVWDTEEHYQAGMAEVQARRTAAPERLRPPPTTVERLEIYASLDNR